MTQTNSLPPFSKEEKKTVKVFTSCTYFLNICCSTDNCSKPAIARNNKKIEQVFLTFVKIIKQKLKKTIINTYS